MDFKREVLTFAQQGLLRRGWTDIPVVALTVVKAPEGEQLQGTSANLWTRECIGLRKYLLEFARDSLAHHVETYEESPPEPRPVLQ